MQAACDAKLSILLNIFSLFYNKMDAEFQWNLPFLTATTLIDGFLQIIEEKKTV